MSVGEAQSPPPMPASAMPDGYTFNSKATVSTAFGEHFTEADVKAEPMLFNCDVYAARALGGPITRAFLDAVQLSWPDDYLVIDSRVHMLMPGWLPCIPGFHHDDVPRTRADGQPDYDAPAYRSEHAMGLVNGDICPTVFATGECVMPRVDDRQPIYRRWHSEVERLIYDGKMHPMTAPSNRVIFFDWQSFHAGTRAVRSGWRWFGRVSRRTERTQHCTNETRQQVQVYLDNAMEGW